MSKEHLTAGIDPGSSAVKVAVVRSRAGEEARVLATTTERFRRRDVTEVVQNAFTETCKQAGVEPGDLDYAASTGDGDTAHFRTGHFYSMTTHARGALFLEPEARAALDAGALHARALRFDHRGKVVAHRMTSQCASGSGQFVENISRYLGMALEDVGELSLRSQAPEKCSSICAVLAETDVINMVSRGISTPDILKGIHLSIAGRLVRLLRATGTRDVVLVTGGLALNQGLVACIREILEEERKPHDKSLTLRTHPDSVLAGALGAALLGAYRYDQLERTDRLKGVIRDGTGTGVSTPLTSH